MEYIDNSLDSAESYFDVDKNSYSRPIEITLKVKGDNNKSGKVFVMDNCTGITNFNKVVESIGNSDKKKADFTMNGQFGFGIYSFMASCETLEVTSKVERKQALYLPIRRSQFQVADQKDVVFPDPKVASIEFQTGTKICLCDFDKNSWKQIDVNELKTEIEKHFELMLARQNLTVKLVGADGKEQICLPFNYNEFDGEVYEEHLKQLTIAKGRRVRHEAIQTLRKPIHLFIKVTKGKTINKNPVFVAKGRRIGEVKDIRSFKSNHKSDLWGHPNVTGYIDLSDFLEPTIARNDFKNTDQSRAFFNKLLELEPLILDVVKDVNKQSEDRHYKELEDRLNQALSRLAKLDSMNFRTDFITGNKINLEQGGSGQSIGNDFGNKDRGESESEGRNGGRIGENEGAGLGPHNTDGNIPGGEREGNKALNKEADNPFEDTGFKGGERKKSGFNIRIVDNEPDIDSVTNKPLRSVLVGSEIRIFKQHQDFELRVTESRARGKKISQRLITYLAGEITVHYKDKFHNRSGQPEYNKNMFIDLVDFVYQLEESLKDLEGKNLSDLN
jgi:hypothetical protein